ncbi:hypothetical protein BaRGS_00039506 [Batillaria attramentaria]|uniref:Uncharacterized protein n=1 Tax=Batillaria attramentaria TaxID=370345 RepID=A0ABD0J3J4_9CAEN
MIRMRQNGRPAKSIKRLGKPRCQPRFRQEALSAPRLRFKSEQQKNLERELGPNKLTSTLTKKENVEIDYRRLCAVKSGQTIEQSS